MKITTLQFGDIELSEEQIVTFAHGIPAFEDLSKFAVISVDENVPFSYLQSLENGDLSFIITNPFLFYPEYEFQLSDTVIEELNIADESEVGVWGIVTVPDRLNEATINLLAPVVINSRTRHGKQIILHDTPYTTKHRLISRQNQGYSETEGDEHARTHP